MVVLLFLLLVVVVVVVVVLVVVVLLVLVLVVLVLILVLVLLLLLLLLLLRPDNCIAFVVDRACKTSNAHRRVFLFLIFFSARPQFQQWGK